MTDFLICEIALPGSPDMSLSWVGEQTDALMHAYAMESLGTPDFYDPMPVRIRNHADQRDSWGVYLVAAAGVDGESLPKGRFGLPELSWDADVEQSAPGRLLGVAGADGSTRDNLHLGMTWVFVAEPERHRGVGSALLAAAEQACRDKDRRTVTSWSDHAPAAEHEMRLVPPTGVGSVGVDAAARFALSHGYSLEQCERHSICPLPCDEDALTRLWEESLPKADGYTIRTWSGRCPDEMAQPVCDLLEHFTVEAPNAGLEFEAEHWDVERLRRGEERREANGKMAYAAVAVCDATGEVAAMTELSAPASQPTVVFQNVTIVDSAHRGHRLGWLVKVANVRQIQAADPGRERIHTWNAGENQWMLAINDAMGFQARIMEGAWQKKLSD